MRKDEIRHDPVRENIVKGAEYIKNNNSTVLKIIAGLIIIVASISYYTYRGNIRFENASHIAGLAQNTFINGEIDEAIVKFERVLDDYPATTGATQSLIYLLNDVVSQEDYETASNLIARHKGGIDRIDDPIVKAAIFKIQGDMGLINRSSDYGLSFYYQAEKNSKGNESQVKYQLDVITSLLKQKDYKKAKNILENILNIKDVGFNEKNKAEELMAYVIHKLGT